MGVVQPLDRCDGLWDFSVLERVVTLGVGLKFSEIVVVVPLTGFCLLENDHTTTSITNREVLSAHIKGYSG